MPASPNQLDEIYRQVRENFISHPVVTVNPIKGDPPDRYEIIYTVAGMHKTNKGQVVESSNHSVELAVPFGFPHFPPSCKPKSDIFHPDFDPAAICLGDYWNHDRSLSDLIVHIGQMINGEFYSTTNAFNEEAAEWYLENSGKFPLTKIKWDTPNNSISPVRKVHTHDIDTLDDADFETEFDSLALEERGDDEDIILNTSFPEVDPGPAIDLKVFTRLKAQKKHYTLLTKAENDTGSSDELNRLCQKSRDITQRAEKLHLEAKKFEDKGEPQTALEKYEQIITLTTDFPNIDSDLQRIKQTLALLGDVTPDIAKPINKAIPKTSGKARPSKPSDSENPFPPLKRSRKPIYLSLGLGTLAIVFVFSGYLWYASTDKLNEAEAAYAQCSASYEKTQFDVAKRLCDKALALVEEIRFIHQDKTHQLEKSIVNILQSEQLTQSLAGNILFDGRYIPKAEATNLQLLRQKLTEAEVLFAEKKWQSALQLYQNISTMATDNPYLDPILIEEIQRNHFIAQFRSFYDPALVSMQNRQWEDAIEKLLQAQKILVSLPESDRHQYSEQLQEALQKSQFANLKEQGDQSFTGADWLSAISTYNLALSRGQETSLSPESIDAIRNNIKRAELYTAINKGNRTFAAGSWDDAIESYSKARSLLIGNQNISSESDSDLNIRKLDRIILQASIIRDRQSMENLTEDNDLIKVRHIYQQILTNIAHSSFEREDEFAKTTIEISKAMQSLDQQIYQMKRVEYLKENYQSLFVANYPSAVAERLTNPVISNTKDTDSTLVFRMQCTESGGGRPLTLVMFYAYDKKTGQWSLFSQN
jgi:ubiquitin-protein ligase